MDTLQPITDNPVAFFVTVGITLAVAALAQGFITKPIHELFSRSSLKGESIVINIVRAIIACIVVCFLGENVFHVEMWGIAETLGITTLIVTLGLQDLIKNLLSGLQIITTNVFVPGDQLIMSDKRGEVKDIGWRKTVLRDKDGNSWVIPNSRINENEFLHLEGQMVRRHTITCYVKPRLDLDRVAEDIEHLADETLEALGCKAPEPSAVRFLSVMPDGVETSIRIFLTDIEHTTKASDAVIRAIARRGYVTCRSNEAVDQEGWA